MEDKIYFLSELESEYRTKFYKQKTVSYKAFNAYIYFFLLPLLLLQ